MMQGYVNENYEAMISVAETYLPKQRDLHQILSLALDESSVSQLAKIPPLHRDPFDRMLDRQALQNGLSIATVDAAVRAYPVSTM